MLLKLRWKESYHKLTLTGEVVAQENRFLFVRSPWLAKKGSRLGATVMAISHYIVPDLGTVTVYAGRRRKKLSAYFKRLQTEVLIKQTARYILVCC